MTADDDRTLDPDRIATRGFSTSFRGFDTEEVRRFLEELASALRTQKERVSGVAVVESASARESSDQADLVSRISDLEGRLSEAQTNLLEAEQAAVETEAAAEDSEDSMQEFDESTMTALLGQETTRVLDAARDAARDIRTRAEEESRQKIEDLETQEKTVAAELERKRTELDELTTTMKTEAAEEATKVSTEATAAASAMRTTAEEEAATLLKAARDEATETRSSAKEESVRLKAQTESEVTTLRAEAEEAAASVRTSAEADASSSQDAAREQARQMLNEAQAVREKVLADLVKRRRVGRQQLDQVKAARDRLARSLAVVRKELDEAMGELVTAVPDARAAMEAVGRRIPESSDKRQAVELGVELDTARVAGIPLPGMPDDDDVDPMPDIDELFNRIKSGDSEPDAETKDSGSSSAGSSSAGSSSAGSSSKDSPPKEPASKGSGSTASGSKRAGSKDSGSKGASKASNKADMSKAATKDVERTGKGDDVGSPESKARVVAQAAGATATKTKAQEPVTEAAAPEATTAEAPATDTKTDESDADIPGPFLARDVAMTRFGPDLRRQIKRALADDQSHILDLLRQSREPISADTLPAADTLRDPYLAAFRTALAGAADAGADVAGGSVKDDVVDDLVESLTRSLLDPLREKVERLVTDAADKNEVTEPLRAHYREARSNQLPDMVDDALASAFALGHFIALKSGTSVVWLADPRFDAGPDCYDNTLAGSVKKSEKFPTGHAVPPGSPGCRCLVLAAS